MSDSVPRRVRAVLGDGPLTRAQLRGLGVTDGSLARAVHLGLARRVSPGLYAAPDDPADPLRTALAATGGAACGPTAALVHGLPLVAEPEQAHVAVPPGGHRGTLPGVRLHRLALHPDEVDVLDGLRVTGLVRTVLDCGRRLPLAEAVAVADAALHAGLVLPGELRRAAGVARGPGGRGLRAAVGLSDGTAESVLESLARVLLTQGGLAPPRTQHVVRDELGRYVARVDFAWPDARLVVEVDGHAWHSTREQVRRDRARTNRLVLLGWRVLRFGWEEAVARPDAMLREVRAALADAARAG